MVVALFGKEALIHFLDESVNDIAKREIRSLTEAEVESYAQPFPTGAQYVVKAVIYSLYLLVSAYFISLTVRFVLERAFVAQDSGGRSGNISFYMIFMRTMIVLLVTTPIVGALSNESGEDKDNVYSWFHIFMFNSFGLAFRVADDISRSFNDTKDVYSPIYKVPESDIFKDDFRALIDFGACVQTVPFAGDVDSLDMNITSNNNEVRFKAEFGDCEADISFEIDNSIAENLKALGGSKSGSEYLMTAQVEGFKQHLKSLVYDAMTFSQLVTESNLRSREVRKGATVKLFLSNWMGDCEVTPVERAARVGDWYDFIKQREVMARCLSKRHVQYVSHPLLKDGADVEYAIFSKNWRMSGRTKEVCASGTGSMHDVVNNTGFDYISQCAVTSCAAVNFDNPISGLFECSVAASAAVNMLKAEDQASEGFISNSVRHFTDLNVESINSTSKAPLNSFRSAIELKGSAVTDKSRTASAMLNSFTSDDSSITFSIPYTGSTLSEGERESLEEGWLSTRLLDSKRPSNKHNHIRIEAEEPFFAETDSGMNPLKRLHFCVMNANSMTEHGYCGSVMSEVTKLGSYASSAALALVIGDAFGQKVNAARSKLGRDKSAKAEVSGRKKVSPSKSKKASKWVLDVAQFAFAPLIALVVMKDSDSNGDDFYGAEQDSSESDFISIIALSTAAAGVSDSAQGAGLAGKVKELVLGCLFYIITIAFIVIPLLPLLFLYKGVVVAVASMLSLFVSAQFTLISVLANADEINPLDRIKKAVSVFIVAFVRIPLVVMGFCVAIHMIDVIVPSFTRLLHETLWNINSERWSGSVMFVVEVFTLFVSLALMLGVVYMCMDVVNQLYSVSRSLLMNDENNESGEGESVEAGSAIQRKAKSLALK
ncbi:TPA: hypothetical protein ACF35N_004495 [Vibrio parahaemolyticus]